jgi:hypothetical protein
LAGTKALRHGGTKGFGKREGAGEAGGEVEGEEGFADAGVADDEGDFAAGDAVGPEPLDGFLHDGVVGDRGGGGGHGGLLPGEGRGILWFRNRRGIGVSHDLRWYPNIIQTKIKRI